MEIKSKQFKTDKKIVCIYHSIDLDGWMSAAIVKHWWQKQQGSYIQEGNHITNPNTGEDSIDFIGYNYGQPIPDLSEYDKVIMCDISFPKEEMFKLYHNLDKELIWIDHHKSAMEDNADLVFKGIRDVNFAACELTWKYFFSNPIDKYGELEEQNPMPEIVRLLGRYDCFGHKGTDEEQYVLNVQYGARSIITNYNEAYEWLQYALKDEILASYNGNAIHQQIEQKGNHIYAYLCKEAKQIYENGFEIELLEECFDGILFRNEIRKFICINKERFNPINFGIDYHKEGYDGCACFHYDGKQWKFSLYNDNGLVDCSSIAKQYGGGGHAGAAGFVTNSIENFIKTQSNG